jgi:drug/metabolite transporter (DMT)-like permease
MPAAAHHAGPSRPLPTLRADLALAAAAFLFGSTFLVMQRSVEEVEPVPFIAARFAIGAIVLLPMALLRERPSRAIVRDGGAAGVALAAGYVFQTVGLQYTTSSVSAFLTYLLVVFVPLLSAVLLRRPPLPSTLAGVLLAVTGLLALTAGAGTGGIGLGRGEILTILCAVAFAVHIIILSAVANRHDVVSLNCTQFAVVTALLVVPSVAVGGWGFPAGVWWSAVYLGVVVSAVAFGLQVYGQRRVSASRTALVLMLEPVFAAVLGWLDGERLGALGALGAGLILAGILLSELRPSLLTERSVSGQPAGDG